MKTEYFMGREDKIDMVCWENMKSLLVHGIGLDA